MKRKLLKYSKEALYYTVLFTLIRWASDGEEPLLVIFAKTIPISAALVFLFYWMDIAWDAIFKKQGHG